MKIVQADNKRQYEVEQKPLIRVLSSGIKLTDKMMDVMGLSVGDKVNYAVDEDNDDALYLYKSEEGSIIGKNKAFTNSGLLGKMKAKADASTLEIKGGNHIIFVMDTEATEFEGTEYFGMKFDEVVLGGNEDEKSEAAKEADEELAVE